LGGDLEPLARAALARLRAAPLPWLLIYDNAPGPEAIADLLPASNAIAIITSRWSDWHGVATELAIDVFTPEIARLHLLHRTRSDDTEGAHRLAAALDFLPLAVEQAGALCRRAGLSFDEYTKRAEELIRLRPAGSNYPGSVFGTFSLAIDEAARRSPDAERLLGMLAFLNPEDIPLSFFGPAVIDLIARTEALEALTGLSLVAVSGSRLRVHRLVQSVARQRIHETRAYDGLRPTIYELLRSALTEQRHTSGPELETIYGSILWALHHDPDPSASFQCELVHIPAHIIEIEVTFTKRASGIFRVLRVMDWGRPFHRAETLYLLEGGWRAKQISDRTF
jgi:hypothetical protein